MYAVFVVPSGLIRIAPGKEDEFFQEMSSEVKSVVIEGTALALATFEHLDFLYPLIVQNDQTQNAELKEAFRNSIRKMGADVEAELIKAREKFRKLTESRQAILMARFMS